MSSTIWKYPLDLSRGEEIHTLKVPAGAVALSAQWQDEAYLSPAPDKGITVPLAEPQLCIWFVVDPDRDPEARMFAVATTGNPLPAGLDELDLRQYVGTVQRNGIVLHVFEV